MAYKIKISKEEKEERKNIVYGANSHIQSLKVALAKYKKGSNVEGQYSAEHYDKLGYYIKKLDK